MPFAPADLVLHARLGVPNVPEGEVYSRVGLEGAVTEGERAAYMEAADAWVIESGGYRRFNPDYYWLPPGTLAVGT